MEAEAEVERLETESASAGQKTAEDWEAIIEAVLFTMGNSVELKQLAVAIGQSEDIAKRVVLHLQKRYEEEKARHALWNWKTRTRCAPVRIITRI